MYLSLAGRRLRLRHAPKFDPTQDYNSPIEQVNKLIGTDWNNPFGDGNSSEIIVEDLKQLSKDDNFKKHKPSDYQFDISNSFKG